MMAAWPVGGQDTSARVLARAVTCLGVALLTGACQTLSLDGGMDTVAGIARSELQKDAGAILNDQDAAAARKKVKVLLSRPLTADGAVQIALLNNLGLQAVYQQLFRAEATAVASAQPPSPTIALTRLVNPIDIEIERQILVNILALATLPTRSEIATDRIRQAQLAAAEETLRVAAETRRAYFRAVGAREQVAFLTQAHSSGEQVTKLAARLGKTGAINKLDQAREQAFHAELTGQLAVAQRRADSERERLVRFMGLWGKDLAFELPEMLPALPTLRSLPHIEKYAMRKRVDLQMARLEVDALAKSLGLTQATRFVNVLEVGGKWDTVKGRSGGDRVQSRGVEVEFSVPLFDFGGARMRQAESTYMEAVHRLGERAVNIRSEAREAYRTYRSAHDIARHYRDEVMPLRKIVTDEMLLRYNAMIVDVFELLTEVRQRITATGAAIEAQRDFWLANTELSVAVSGGGVAPAPGESFGTAVMAADGQGRGH